MVLSPQLTPGAASYGVTVAEALRLPCLSRARLAAGADGADRRLRVVNIMEVPDIIRWMRGGELLLTTAYPLRDDAQALIRLVSDLAERGVAALGIKFGPYLAGPPEGLLELANRLRFPLVEIPPDVIFNDVLTEVLGTILNRQALELERSSEIHERLTQVILAGGSMVELVRALSDLIGLPTAIVDDRGHLVASAGEVPMRATGAQQQLTPQLPATRVSIRTRGLDDGEVLVWAGSRELRQADVVAVERVAVIAALAIAQERALFNRERRHQTLFLMELVSGHPVNRADAIRRAAAMGWDLEFPRAVVLVDLATSEGPVRVADQPIEERLVRDVNAACGRKSVVWALGTGLAILADPRPSVGDVCSVIRGRLARWDPSAHVMIGAGGVSADPDDLPKSYREAVEAVTLGRQLYGSNFVVRHEELGVYRLLSRVPEGQLRAHCEETLGPLTRYDDQHQGSLVETLDSYFRVRGNRVEAARKLCIHYNTLRYRLDLIDQLTGGIDRDPTSRLGLELALHARCLVATRAATGERRLREGKQRKTDPVGAENPSAQLRRPSDTHG